MQEAFAAAKKQMEELRAQVEKTGQMASLKVQGEFLHRDLDRAYRDLGEAVWKAVKAGRGTLPSGVNAQVKALEEAEKQWAAHQTAINDILDEGAQVAGRLKAEKKTTTQGKVLASRGKKR